MRVAVDSTPLLNQRTGIGQYTYYLVNNLLDVGNDLELVLFCTSLRKSAPLAEIIPKRPHLAYADYRFPARAMQKLWRTIGVPRVEFFTGKIDIFHATNFIAPPQRAGRLILTIHDVGFARMPAEHPEATRAYAGSLPQEISRADKVIAVSDFTKDEVIDVLGVPEQKVTVIHNGVAPAFHVIENDRVRDVLDKYGISKKYILFVGKIEARKNLSGIIDAFEIFKSKSKFEHQLVLVGSLGWRGQEAFDKIASYSLEEQVMHLGYVADEELPLLMGGADVFLYPSLYEGFGIPPLEAMACGTPVVASKTTSLPEVIGDAGVLVDPHSPDEIADALTEVLSDSGLRNHLIERGLKRAARFTWAKTAEKTLRLYEEVL